MDSYCPLRRPEAGGEVSGQYVFLVSKLAVDVCVCVLILAGNAFTLCALLHQRWCRKDTLCPRFKVSSLFVMNLAVADFLIGCAMALFLVAHYVCSIAELAARSELLCVLKTATYMFAGTISVTTLAAISVDRYVAVIHSLRYPEYMTRRRACTIIALTWVVGLAGAASLFFWNHFEAGQPCLDTVIPDRHLVLIGAPLHAAVFAIVLVAHLRIWREVQRMRARRRLQEKSIFGAQVQRGSIKSMRAVVLVVGCYVACYVPFMCVFTARLLGVRSAALDVLFQCLCTVTSFNAMLNPFIYSWKNASVRTALRQFVAKLVRLAKRGGGGRAEQGRAGKQASSTSTASSSAVAVITDLGRYVPYSNVI